MLTLCSQELFLLAFNRIGTFSIVAAHPCKRQLARHNSTSSLSPTFLPAWVSRTLQPRPSGSRSVHQQVTQRCLRGYPMICSTTSTLNPQAQPKKQWSCQQSSPSPSCSSKPQPQQQLLLLTFQMWEAAVLEAVVDRSLL